MPGRCRDPPPGDPVRHNTQQLWQLSLPPGAQNPVLRSRPTGPTIGQLRPSVQHHAPPRAGHRVDPVHLENDRPPQRTAQLGALVTANQDLLTGDGKVHGMDLRSPLYHDTQAPHHLLSHQLHTLRRIQLFKTRIQLGNIHHALPSSHHYTPIPTRQPEPNDPAPPPPHQKDFRPYPAVAHGLPRACPGCRSPSRLRAGRRGRAQDHGPGPAIPEERFAVGLLGPGVPSGPHPPPSHDPGSQQVSRVVARPPFAR